MIPGLPFPWLFTLNNQLKSAKPDDKIENVVFIKTGGGKLQPTNPYTIFLTPIFNNCLRFVRKTMAKENTWQFLLFFCCP